MSDSSYPKQSSLSSGQQLKNIKLSDNGDGTYSISTSSNPRGYEVGTDAAGRSRISSINTLFDGKTLNEDDTLIWENVGSGSGLLIDNKFNIIVEVGEYFIRRGKHITPYFSGKSQLIETTFDNFSSKSGVKKKVGYFSSSSISPYNTVYDGFWLELSDGLEATIKIFNSGTLIASIPLSGWDNLDYFINYDFDNFTIVLWDFLWLGGSELRLFIKTDKGFVLAHTYVHASTKKGTIIKSPNQSVRYEIEGVSSSDDVNAICSTVGTEGEFPGAGSPISIISPTVITGLATDTIYAIKGVKKTETNRDISVVVTGASISNVKKDDPGIFYILLNPTLSSPLGYINNSKFSEGTGDKTQTIDSLHMGRVLRAIPSGVTGTITDVNDSLLSNLGMTIDDISDEIILAYQPSTADQDIKGIITLKEY